MIVREATPQDASATLAIYAPYVRETAISFETAVPSQAEWQTRIDALQPQFPWLIAEREGELLGYAYGGPHRSRAAYRWNVEVSVYVARQAQRQGVARRLYGVLFELLELQGYVNALAGISLPNPASVGFHESLGFAPVGVYRGVGFKRGAWHDVGWWSRDLAARRDSPGEPTPASELRGSPAWRCDRQP